MDNRNKEVYMQSPISLLTNENLYALELHCEKQIRREVGQRVREHEIVLELIHKYKKQQKEIEKQNKENIDLKDLYIRTAKHQEKIGHVELAEYMLAQIQAIPIFTTWEEYTTWVSKEDLRKILDKYKHKEIDQAPEFYKELKKIVEE